MAAVAVYCCCWPRPVTLLWEALPEALPPEDDTQGAAEDQPGGGLSSAVPHG